MKCFSWSLDTVGRFARTVGEVRESAQAVCGGRVRPVDRRDWRIGVPRSNKWGDGSVSAARAMQSAIEALRSAGATVVDFELPTWAASCFVAHDAVQGWEASRTLAHEFEKHREQLSPLLRDYLAEARTTS